MTMRDTIAAVATAAGRSGIGIVRISGPGTHRIAEGILGDTALPPRRAVLADFRDGAGRPIDRGVAIHFPAPHSYTGESVLELHGHGGPVVLRLLLERCVELGARVAEPGEFTRRAYLNSKLDLAQAEGVIDLIEAATGQAARSAMRSLSGEFSLLIQELMSSLVRLRTVIEATLDFPEEEIDPVAHADVTAQLNHAQAQLQAVLEAARRGSLLREGIHIVLAGQPNVGKSSLLNRLAGEDLAIVTDIPGTTRDSIRQAIDLGGVPCHVVDTAGLRDPLDPVEEVGIGRTWAALQKADLVLLLVDVTRGDTPADREIAVRLPANVATIRVLNKIDLIGAAPRVEQRDGMSVWLSAKTGQGLDLLREAILERVGWRGADESGFLARARHLEALSMAHSHLQQASGQLQAPELLAEELRLAHEALGAITGKFTADDLLGEIFSRFCIGK